MESAQTQEKEFRQRESSGILFFKKEPRKKHLPFAYLGELFGTSVIGGLLSWPIAAWLMGSESAVYGFILPFFVSSCGGTILAVVLVTAMKRMRVFDVYLGNLEPRSEQHARS